MKKLMILALLAVALMLLAACGNNEDEHTGDGLHLTWYINYDWFSAMPFPNPTNAGEVWLHENKNLSITFMDPAGAPAQRLSTMILDRDFPDVLTVERGQDLDRLLLADALVPIDEFLPGSNLEKFLGMDLLNMFRSPDGYIYTIPNWAIGEGFANGNFGWMINEYYYNALGRPPLNTFDDLHAYLTLVREQFPNVLPMHIGENLAGASLIFGGMAENNNPGFWGERVYNQGNQLVSFLENPLTVETFLFVNRLYRENLIQQDLFTMTGDQRRELIRNGSVAVLCLTNVLDSTGEMAALAAENPDMTYLAIPPLVAAGVNPNNMYSGSHTRMGWNVAVISVDAADPQATFEMLDWMFGNEGQLVFAYGPPGDFYDFGEYTPEGFPIRMNDAFFDAPGYEITGRWSDANWVGNTSFIDGMGIHLYNQGADVSWTTVVQIHYIWPFSADATELSGLAPGFNTPEGIIYQDLDLLYRQAIPSIVLAPSEEAVRANIANYIDELYANGLQQLLNYQTAVWLANRAALGR